MYKVSKIIRVDENVDISQISGLAFRRITDPPPPPDPLDYIVDVVNAIPISPPFPAKVYTHRILKTMAKTGEQYFTNFGKDKTHLSIPHWPCDKKDYGAIMYPLYTITWCLEIFLQR